MDGEQMKNKIILALSLTIAACSQTMPIDHYSHYMRNNNIPAPTTKNLPHCYNYGCKTIQSVSVNPALEQELTKLFTPSAPNALQERERISDAIRIFESHIGEQTGTEADLKGTFKPFTRKTDSPLKFQQDCVDESTNTTAYLSYINQKGWLHFHRITQPQSRQPFINGNSWWHQSATIKDKNSGKQYAVDSWFEDNGKPAHIIPIEEWFKNWHPPENTRD